MKNSIFKTLVIVICVIAVPLFLQGFGLSNFFPTAISITVGVIYLSKFFGQDIGHLKMALLNFLFLFLLFGIPDFVLDLYIDYKLSVLHEGSMEYKKYFNLSIDREWKSLVPVISFMSSFAYSLWLYVVLKIVVLFKKIKN
jgi:hypothetical protein